MYDINDSNISDSHISDSNGSGSNISRTYKYIYNIYRALNTPLKEMQVFRRNKLIIKLLCSY